MAWEKKPVARQNAAMATFECGECKASHTLWMLQLPRVHGEVKMAGRLRSRAAVYLRCVQEDGSSQRWVGGK